MTTPAQIKQYASILFDAGQVVEIRALKKLDNGKTYSGFFDDIEKFSNAAANMSGKFSGVYFTLNPVDPIQFPATNTIQSSSKATSDKAILKRRWVLVDVDPNRPAGTSSSNEELSSSKEKIYKIRDYLTASGFPLPIVATSGNGSHLLYHVDMQNDDEAKKVVSNFLKGLAEKYNDDQSCVDISVSNAARICRLYGTANCKGDNTEERPHRVSEVLEVPGFIESVDISLMAAIKPNDKPAAVAGQLIPKLSPGGGYFQALLDGAINDVAMSGPGTRNNTLNASAYKLGSHMVIGDFSEADCRARLESAATACGIDDMAEIRKTIDSGIFAGMNKPVTLAEFTAKTDEWKRNNPRRTTEPSAGVIERDNPGDYLSGVDWYSPFPDVNGKGAPKSTIENIREAVRRLGINVRYNEISKEIEILIPHQSFTIDNKAEASLAWVSSACNRFGIPTGNLGEFLCFIADENIYNPVRTWIQSKPWDGVSRLPSLYSTLKMEGEENDSKISELKETLIKRWLLSAVGAAFETKGISAHGVLVLQGEQYLGKTAWFKRLAPPDLEVIQDGLILRPDDRDSVKQVVSYWMVELGELDATFSKSDIAQLKAFITRQKDVFRRAYAKCESHYVRRTVFFASVNPRQFLHDPTGNRRYWTIPCVEIDHKHTIDMQQLWAEVYENLYAKGEKWFLLDDELKALNGNNEEFEVIDPILELLQSRMNWDANKANWLWMYSTEICKVIGINNPTTKDSTACTRQLKKMGCLQSEKTKNGRKILVPPFRCNY